MSKLPWLGAAGWLMLTLGCQSGGPLGDFSSPMTQGAAVVTEANPLYVALGPESYHPIVFQGCLRVLGEYGFEIKESNSYDGRIETSPRVAPGLGLFLKPGSPDLYDRLLSTTQSYRHRVFVTIQPADQGGFFIQVTAFKELEDLPRPLRSTVGAAIFRNDNNVERQFEVVDPTVYESNWIFKGRDLPLEQELIRRLKRCM